MPYLVNTSTLCLDHCSNFPEEYAIVSHTWGEDEVLFDDMNTAERRSSSKAKKGYQKLATFAALALQDGFQQMWMDTCCINKSSSTELNEAINSMHLYYQGSTMCYCYFEDVKTHEDLPKARWFTRGWTLQELIFSPDIMFYGVDKIFLGDKMTLLSDLASVTGIDTGVLTGGIRLGDVTIARRMSWLANRSTTRPEDIAYCMLGIFDISLPLLYGEKERAFRRLQEELLRRYNDQSILAWTGPPSAWGALADSHKVFANVCSCLSHNNMTLATRSHFRVEPDAVGLRATMICWLDNPMDPTRWHAILDNQCSRHPGSPHVITLRQPQPRKLEFVRVETETHIIYGDDRKTLQGYVAFEEETLHNGRLLKESPWFHNGLCTGASAPAPKFPSIKDHPWQVDLLEDDDRKKFYRADICPRPRDIVIRSPNQSEFQRGFNRSVNGGNRSCKNNVKRTAIARFMPSRLVEYNKKRPKDKNINQIAEKAPPDIETNDSNKLAPIQVEDLSPTVYDTRKSPLSADEGLLKYHIYDILKTFAEEGGTAVEDDWFLVMHPQV